MKKTILLLTLLPLLGGCAAVQETYDRVRFGANPYQEPPFYARYLDPARPLDRDIWSVLEKLRVDPGNPQLHNELGTLLVTKGFPVDAEREFLRAVRNDGRLYAAWYNLGLIRQAQGNHRGAIAAFRETVDLKPGHAPALFQLGLIHEKRGATEAAIEYYAKSYAINPAMLDVRVNPRIVETSLVDRALLVNYDTQKRIASSVMQTVPTGYVDPRTRDAAPAAPSDVPQAEDIVTPAPPVTQNPQGSTNPPGR